MMTTFSLLGELSLHFGKGIDHIHSKIQDWSSRESFFIIQNQGYFYLYWLH